MLLKKRVYSLSDQQGRDVAVALSCVGWLTLDKAYRQTAAIRPAQMASRGQRLEQEPMHLLHTVANIELQRLL